MRRTLLIVVLIVVVIPVVSCRPAATKPDPAAARLGELERQAQALESIVDAEGLVAPSSAEATSDAEDPRVRAAEDRVRLLTEALHAPSRLSAEPTGDVTAGTFLAFVTDASLESSTPEVVVDLVTSAAVPWATKQDLERSSWSQWFGWNRVTHPQTVALAADASLVVGDENASSWTAVDPRAFAARFDRLGPDQKYYVRVEAGSSGSAVTAIWPWTR